jgi:hypothetical protein
MVAFFTRVLLITGLVIPGLLPVGRVKPVSADWCQCVIFVLNLMGIEQIPGEYWTAASLAMPDDTGKTWMDYQGFSKRRAGELPQPGDLLVLAGGAEVVTGQSWDGTEHLVHVPVDVWAGHIGIVENAQKIEKDGQPYLQVTLLSANWGVNAKPAGVVGSCYNVDESTFLLPDSYKKAQFFFAVDPIKMRERVVNRAKRWSLLGITANPQVTMDGYPITPVGFASAALQEPGELRLTPSALEKSNTDLVEIYGAAAQPGDVVIFAGGNGDPGYGIISGNRTPVITCRQVVFQLISMQPGGRVTGPETWNLIRRDENWIRVLPDNSVTIVRFYRFDGLPGYPLPGTSGITWVRDIARRVSVTFTLLNGGGNSIEITNLFIQARSRQTDVMGNHLVIKFPEETKITLKAGEMYTYSYSVKFPTAGEYELDAHYEWQNLPILTKNVTVIQVN